MTHPVPDSASQGDVTLETVGQERASADRRAVGGGKTRVRCGDERADPDPRDTVGHRTLGVEGPFQL